MTPSTPIPYPTQRALWLRRGTIPSTCARRSSGTIHLSVLGVAAARETFVTATAPFTAAWTDLFRGMLTDSPVLRWRENGPGVGRDARIAYSGLLGRYMTRAYLTAYEGVRVLVPLDEAKRVLTNTPYSIGKSPGERGLEADWVGLDSRGCLVIAEAKGSFDPGLQAWLGPNRIPKALYTAIGQARRTNVFKNTANKPLPARRWAVASRWANEDNQLCPALLAWDSDEGQLDACDYQELARLFFRAEVETVLAALGLPEAAQLLDAPDTEAPLPRAMRLGVGPHTIESGFAALVGPVGIFPLRDHGDLDRVRQIREWNPTVALASLSRRYVTRTMRQPDAVVEPDDQRSVLRPNQGERIGQKAGMTVAWPLAGEDIVLADD